jgi:hypothetical protein
MTQSDDRTEESLYRGVTIEMRHRTGIRDGQQIDYCSWVARSDTWIVIASSIEELREAIDGYLDRP